MALSIVVTLLFLHVVQTLNLRLFRKPASGTGEGACPPQCVSVLIPARDEERNIESCVRSIAGQAGVLEVLVLDDDSSDRTAEIVAAIAAPDLKLLRGAPLPEGWRGKNWACHQLAQGARGEWLLFTDADTVHQRESVAASVAHAIANQSDLLSLFPRQILGTWMERLLIPLLSFTFVSFFPAFMLARSRDPRFHAANGQFLLFRRAAYDRIGGHESIRNSVVDDFALARRTREEALTLTVGDGQDQLSCRMYDSARGVVDGFTKNLFAAVGQSSLRAVAIAAFLVILFVVPPVIALVTADRRWLSATALGLALRLRVTLRRSDDPFLSAILHPLGIASAALILMRSMLRTTFGWKVEWKGRGV